MKKLIPVSVIVLMTSSAYANLSWSTSTVWNDDVITSALTSMAADDATTQNFNARWRATTNKTVNGAYMGALYAASLNGDVAPVAAVNAGYDFMQHLLTAQYGGAGYTSNGNEPSALEKLMMENSKKVCLGEMTKILATKEKREIVQIDDTRYAKCNTINPAPGIVASKQLCTNSIFYNVAASKNDIYVDMYQCITSYTNPTISDDGTLGASPTVRIEFISDTKQSGPADNTDTKILPDENNVQSDTEIPADEPVNDPVDNENTGGDNETPTKEPDQKSQNNQPQNNKSNTKQNEPTKESDIDVSVADAEFAIAGACRSQCGMHMSYYAKYGKVTEQESEAQCTKRAGTKNEFECRCQSIYDTERMGNIFCSSSFSGTVMRKGSSVSTNGRMGYMNIRDSGTKIKTVVGSMPTPTLESNIDIIKRVEPTKKEQRQAAREVKKELREIEKREKAGKADDEKPSYVAPLTDGTEGDLGPGMDTSMHDIVDIDSYTPTTKQQNKSNKKANKNAKKNNATNAPAAPLPPRASVPEPDYLEQDLYRTDMFI